jgi:WD40 repeat protein
LAISADGQILACAGAGDGDDKSKTYVTSLDKGLIELWSMSDRHQIKAWFGSKENLSSIALSSDDHILACGGIENIVRIWKVPDGLLLGEFTRQEHNINTLAYSPDGKILASSGHHSPITLWSIPGGEVLRIIDTSAVIPQPGLEPWRPGPETIRNLVFSPDGQMLLSGGSYHILRLWNVADGKLLRQWPSQPGYDIESVVFSPDGRMLAYHGESVQVWGIE